MLTHHTIRPHPRRWAVALSLAMLAGSASADSGDTARNAPALQADHARLQTALANSPFRRPLLLSSSRSTTNPTGEVYAVIDQPFDGLSAALQQAPRWCDVLMLQFNIKRCIASGGGAPAHLQVAVGRKADQPAAQAFQLDFRFALKAAQPDWLSVQMSADDGPLGTRDYKLRLEAVPIDAQHSFIHMSYAYASGVTARLATSAYLATAGSDKIGFTITGRDDRGQPVYVRGIQGVAERNAMRYFLAIEALLGSLQQPPAQQAEWRLQAWFAATERYPRQLHEMEAPQYLAMKRRELRTEVALRPVNDRSP